MDEADKPKGDDDDDHFIGRFMTTLNLLLHEMYRTWNVGYSALGSACCYSYFTGAVLASV
jgi:hypothetical protein